MGPPTELSFVPDRCRRRSIFVRCGRGAEEGPPLVVQVVHGAFEHTDWEKPTWMCLALRFRSEVCFTESIFGNFFGSMLLL